MAVTYLDGPRTQTAAPVAWWRTSLGEAEVEGVRQAIAHEHVSQGPVTELFEQEMAQALGVPYAVATTSASVAMLVSLMALGIGPGDEVLVPNRTFVATAHAVLLLRGTVVLVDTLPDSPVMDPEDARRKVTARTRAIMPVHLNGRGVDMDAINELAREHGLAIVEDVAQALFSRDRSGGFLGSRSDMGCYSFGMTKLLQTGQGGLIVTSSAEHVERLRLARNHGVLDTFHTTYHQLGYNFKFTDLLASIGRAQLTRMQQRIERLNLIYRQYEQALDGLDYVRLIPVDVAHGEVSLWVEAVSPEREAFINYLAGKDIETRPFHPSLHESQHLSPERNQGAFPNSEIYAREGLFLPCGPDQPLENVSRTIDAILAYGRRR